MARVRGRKIGFVFQNYQLVPTLTAEENVLLPAELSGMNVAASRQRAHDLLDRVGLSNRTHHYPVQLSGGEQQRVALARAFVTQPPILMADEPTGNLDSTNGQHILDLLVRLNREEKATLVLVTHDRMLAEHADRILTLRDGLILSDELRAQASSYRHVPRDGIENRVARVTRFSREISIRGFCGGGGRRRAQRGEGIRLRIQGNALTQCEATDRGRFTGAGLPTAGCR